MKNNLKSARNALREKRVEDLSGILNSQGFTDFNLNSDIKTNWERLRQDNVKEGPEIDGKDLFGPIAYRDKTDYFSSYEKGFIKIREDWIAAYGILEEINITKKIRLDPPHHFFFIDIKRPVLSDMLKAEAEFSPSNPAANHRTKSSPMVGIALMGVGAHLLQNTFAAYMNQQGINISGGLLSSPEANMIRLFGNVIASHMLWDYLRRPTMKGSHAKSSVIFPEYGYRGIKRYAALIPFP